MKSNLFILLALTGMLALSGCASTNGTGGKGKQALVCPQCKMVAVTVNPPYLGGYVQGYGYGSDAFVTETVYNHTCPGCQGAITTLFKEGKLKHKCSVCKETPFTCPVSHPISS